MSVEHLQAVPHLTTATSGPLQQLESHLLDHQAHIETWFRRQWRATPAPFYASVDLRNAGESIVLATGLSESAVGVLLTGLSSSLAELVVSIAAGISCARLESLLPDGTAVVRVMPNTPALVREGMSVVSGGTEASAEHVDFVREIFSVLGDAIVLDERYQDAATAVSGSGPAYVALFIDALTRAGVRHGLSREVAERLAVRTVAGTAALIDITGQHPEQVIDGVASPGGTTIAGIEALESGGVRAAVSAAVTAAVGRAKELGS